MLTTTATALAGLIGLGVIVLSARAFWAPQAAAGFGIPDTPTEDRAFHSWLSVKAVRDIACGLFIIVVLAGASPTLLGWAMLVAASIPLGDAVIVLRSNGPRSAAYGVHGTTAVVMLGISLLLLVA